MGSIEIVILRWWRSETLNFGTFLNHKDQGLTLNILSDLICNFLSGTVEILPLPIPTCLIQSFNKYKR